MRPAGAAAGAPSPPSSDPFLHRSGLRYPRAFLFAVMRSLDLAVILLYFAAVVAIGASFARRQGGAADYFLGHRDLPWWAVMLSIVATETSAITVISVPGLAARSDL